MARDRAPNSTPPEDVISIIGPGMQVVGDCVTTGSLRIEGAVKGAVRAGKAVVVGKEGFVDGDIETQDAVISGRVVGTLTIASRLELHATCRVEGTIRARRMQLEEGASIDGQIMVGEGKQEAPTLEHIIADGQSNGGLAAPAGDPAFSTSSGKLSKSV